LNPNEHKPKTTKNNQIHYQTRKPVINLKEGTTKGNFNPNHIEAILIGIETQPNTTQTFEIHQISTITYNNQC